MQGGHPGRHRLLRDPRQRRAPGTALTFINFVLDPENTSKNIEYRALRGRRKNILIALVVLPFFVNYLVRTYAWVALLSDEGIVNGLLDDIGLRSDPISFLNTSWAVIGGLVYGYLAFMILPVYAALDRMDPALIEAGKDLYGSGWQTFRHVTWPTTFQGVLAGSVLVFLPAVGDFVSAQLLGGPGTYMIGNLIPQQFFGAENWPFGAALTTVMMAFLMVWMIFYLRSAAKAAREVAAT